MKRSKELGHIDGKVLRKSLAREAILSVVSKAARPVSACAIREALLKRGKVFNKTTIYRELETLKRTGNIRELFLRNDTALYELSGPHHHHALCVACGDIRPVELPEPREWKKEAFILGDGFRVTSHSLEFFGMCRKCQA